MNNNYDGKYFKYFKFKIFGKKDINYYFEVVYYVGIVGYNVDGWLDKNKDLINEVVVILFVKFFDLFIVYFFKDYVSECKSGIIFN